jgi:hypothetical protein
LTHFKKSVSYILLSIQVGRKIGGKMSGDQITLSDNIVRNRGLALPEPKSIPDVTAGYIPSQPSEKKSLRRIAEKLDAEAAQAIDQCVERGVELAKDLGEDVASINQLSALREKKKRLLSLKSKLAVLQQFVEEVDDITNHDIATVLSDLGDEIEHRAKKKPQLESTYHLVLKFVSAHGESVREGKARAQEKKQAEAASQNETE